jgi:DNA topoisomerase VI subunit B
MKHTFNLPAYTMMVVFGLGASMLSVKGYAQKLDTTVHKVERKTDQTAKTVGHKTASTAVKGEATIVDKTYKGKEGPHGENVFIDKKDNKYYVDKKGKKVYLKSWQIRDKKKD